LYPIETLTKSFTTKRHLAFPSKVSIMRLKPTKSMLKELFVSEVRIKILKLLVLNPKDSYHVRAIVRAVGAEINAVRRELANLSEIGLLKHRQSSNRIYYTVEPSHIYYSELLALISKDEGLGKQIIDNSKKLGNIDFAVLSKAFLLGRASTPLDVDLFVVGDPDATFLAQLIKEQEQKNNKEINYTVMPAEEFKHRKRKNDNFIIKVLSQSRTMLIGDEEKFYAIV